MSDAFTLPHYTWRGKTYRTIDGLFRAVKRAFPSCASMGFDPDAMLLVFKLPEGKRGHVYFKRTLPASPGMPNAIEANPCRAHSFTL